MTIPDKHIAQKKKEIEKIVKQQVRLVTKAAAMVAKPSKYHAVNIRRIGKMFAITMQLRALEMQKQMIIAQPIPNFASGISPLKGIAMISEIGSELVVTNTGNVFIPGEIQSCPIGEMVHIPSQPKNNS